jgi:hypothetical protein
MIRVRLQDDVVRTDSIVTKMLRTLSPKPAAGRRVAVAAQR